MNSLQNIRHSNPEPEDASPPPYSASSAAVSNNRSQLPAREPPPLPNRPQQHNHAPISVHPQTENTRTLHFYVSGIPAKGKVKDSDRSTILYQWRFEGSVWRGRKLALYSGSLFQYHRKIGSIGVLRFDIHGQHTVIEPRHPCLYTQSKANPSLGVLR